METKKRNYAIDCLKGFAIILVVLGHVMDGYLKTDIFLNQRNYIFNIFNYIYAFHMPLFFIISGFVFQLAYVTGDSTKPKLKVQLLNLVCVYLVFNLLFGIFKIFCGRFTNADVSWIDILLIPIKSIPPYWYLYVLILYYLIFLLPFMLKIKPSILLGISIFLGFMGSFLPSSYFDFFEARRFLYYLPFFYLGMLIKKGWVKEFILHILTIVSMVASALLMIKFHGRLYNSIPIVSLIIALGCSMLIYQVFMLLCINPCNIGVKTLSKIGQYSLEIYLIHCVFTSSIRIMFSRLGFNNFVLCIVINCFLSLLIPIFISIIMKKLKIHDLLFKPISFIKSKGVVSNV